MPFEFSKALCALLLLAVSAAATVEEKTVLRKYGDKNVAENEGHGCYFPCQVRTENGKPLPHPPKVVWERKLDTPHGTPDSFLPLYHSHWYEEEGLAYDAFRSTQCSQKKDGNGTTYYDCDFHQGSCDVSRYAGEYRCVVQLEFTRAGGITLTLSLNNFGSEGPDGVNPGCILPRPIQFLAGYNETSTLTLTWTNSPTPPNRSVCFGSQSFEVQARMYDSYEDYLSLYIVSGVIDFHGNYTGKFVLDVSEVPRGTYFTFDLRNTGVTQVNSPPIQQTTHSPVFYFERQEGPTVTFPVVEPYVLMAKTGQSVELRCEASGLPPPTVEMYHKRLAITSESSDRSVFRKNLILNKETEGVYICFASNTHVTPQGMEIPFVAHKVISLRSLPSSGPDLDVDEDIRCSTHGNSVCSNYFSNREVLTNSTDTMLESHVQSLLLSLSSSTTDTHSLSEEQVQHCVELARATICHSAFPFCNEQSLATRPMCQRSCDLFRAGGACEGVVTPERFPEAYELMFSRCGDVEFPGGREPECVQLQLEQPTALDATSWCSVDDGQSYSGYVARTESGLDCQDWAVQSPHRHSHFDEARLFRARRHCRNPGGLGERPWCYTIDSQIRWEYCDVPQCRICQPYTEHFCSSLPGYSQEASVYIDRHESEWDELGVQFAESWMVISFLNLTRDAQLPLGCEEGLREFICHSTLPLCSGSATPSRLCSDHCQLMELLQVCPNSIMDRISSRMSETGRSFGQPDCAMKTQSSDTCMPVHSSIRVAGSIVSHNDDEECYNASTSGMDYKGSVSRTESGAVCQAWGNSWPGMEEANYCRNPGNVRTRPWCFTNREEHEWEYCNITECETESPLPITMTEVVRGISSATIGVIVTFAVVGLLLILGSFVLAITIAVVWKHRQKQNEAKELSLLKINRKRDWDYVVNQTYVQVGGLPPKIKEAIDSFRQYDKSSIKYIRQLGSGNFGVVFHGRMEGLIEDQKSVEVAVKTLKEEHSMEGLDDFVREAKLMFSFNHPNIVKILGVCVDDMPYYLIFEYMDKGDLAQFLRASASSLQRREMNPLDGRPRSRTESTLSDEPPALSVHQLADICRQIACGMEYLSNNNHVHRDLACRNCLVKTCDDWEQTPSGYIIKIGDFGMSQNLYTSDYYRVRGQAVLPIRWMSPEAVIYGKFSTDSDVWSFGVVMWEVFSFAMQPYYGTSNEEVTEAIRRHRVLSKPADCPACMYDIMKNCWMLQPKMRPGFDELVKVLGDCRLSVSSSSSPGSLDEYGDDCSELDSDAFYEENSDVEAVETATITTRVTTNTAAEETTDSNSAADKPPTPNNDGESTAATTNA